MTTLEAMLLGLVQGLTEFLPVSSSGHLQLVQHFLGMQNLDHYIFFDLACHLGTLLAIIVIFAEYIKKTFKSERKRLFQVIIATLPLFPLVLLMKPIKAIYANPNSLGFFFMATAIILFIGIRFEKTQKEENKKKHFLRDALIIGIFQAMAILPGISRSGSTISGAKLVGWNARDAVGFSFLLAIPAILGGTVLEIFKLQQHPKNLIDLPLTHYCLGFLISFFVGLITLQLLMRLALQKKLYYFAWYCLILGLMTTYYFYLR